MFDLQDFIGSCERLVAAPGGEKQVLELMRHTVRDSETIKSVVAPADSRQPVSDALLFRSSHLLVLNATLPPYFASPPHDHRMWAVIGIYEGQENNTFYRRSGEGLDVINHRELRAGEALLLGPEVIHAIENPLPSPTLGLHVYGGDVLAAQRSMWSPHSGEELPYDVPQFFKWCAELAKSRSAV
jgi:predicted metal-dependent enzyme (double-stranded beta helix superfamily)